MCQKTNLGTNNINPWHGFESSDTFLVQSSLGKSLIY